MSERAYTYVDRSHAIVGNRWFERTWSGFLGNTVSILQKSGGFEWIQGRSPEFSLVDGEAERDVMDFGEVSWSEENSPEGAALVCRQTRPGLAVTIATLAYHDNPGMRRAMTMHNTGGEAIAIDRVALERLPVAREGLAARTEGFEKEHAQVDWDTEERALALCLDGRGLFAGVEGGGAYRVFTQEPECCVIAVEGPGMLRPGEARRLPAAFLMPYAGPLEDASRQDFAQLLVRLRNTRRREEQGRGGG